MGGAGRDAGAGGGFRGEHDAIGRLAVRLNINRVVAVGLGRPAIHLGASHEGSWDGESLWVPDVEAAVEALRAQARPDDVVLVKASRGVALEARRQALLAGGQADA